LTELVADVGLPQPSGAKTSSAGPAHLIFAAGITGLPVLAASDAAQDTELFRLLVAGVSLAELIGAGILALGFLVAEERRQLLLRVIKKLEADAAREHVQLVLRDQEVAKKLHANAKAIDAALENCKQNNEKVKKCLEQVVAGSSVLLGEAFKQVSGAYKSKLFTLINNGNQTHEFVVQLGKLREEWRRLLQLLKDCLGCKNVDVPPPNVGFTT
jgi:hypothetical protein